MYSPIGVPLLFVIVPLGANTPFVSLIYSTSLKSLVNALYTVAEPPTVSMISPATGGSVKGSTSKTASTFSIIMCSPLINVDVGSVYCTALFCAFIPCGNTSTDVAGPTFLLKFVKLFHLSTNLSCGFEPLY